MTQSTEKSFRLLTRCAMAALLTFVVTSGCGSSSPGSSDVENPDTDAVDDTAGDAAFTDTVRDATGDGAADLPSVDVAPDAARTDSEADAQNDAVTADSSADADTAQPDWWLTLSPSGLPMNGIAGIASQMSTNAAQNDHRDFEYAQYQPYPGFRMRNGHRFDDVERVEGVWEWDRVSGSVDGAAAVGSKVLMGLDYGVDWAQTDDTIDSLKIESFAEYAGQMAGHFCQTVKEYEIWNEPNVTMFWTPEPNPAKYADLVVASYDAIKTACPDAKVAFGALASFGQPDLFATWDFLRLALEARPGLCDYFDVLSLHPYTWLQQVSPEHDEWQDVTITLHSQTAMTAIARQMMADAGCDVKPIWFTEVGWPSYELTEQQVAMWAVRSLLLTAMDGVDAWCWYTFWDREPVTTGIRPHENYFGMFGWPGQDGTVRREKPAWTALTATLDRIGTFRFAGDLSDGLGLPEDVFVLAFTDESGNMVLAGWDGRDQPDVKSTGTMPGGPGTSFDVDVTVPAATTSTILYDTFGTPAEPVGGNATRSLRLTPSPQFMQIITG